MEIDYHAELPRISVPTLVLHRAGEVVPVAGAHYIANAIPGAKIQELPGFDHLVFIGDVKPVLAATREWVRSTAAVVGAGKAEARAAGLRPASERPRRQRQLQPDVEPQDSQT
jgi:hypothetical protein